MPEGHACMALHRAGRPHFASPCGGAPRAHRHTVVGLRVVWMRVWHHVPVDSAGVWVEQVWAAARQASIHGGVHGVACALAAAVAKRAAVHAQRGRRGGAPRLRRAVALLRHRQGVVCEARRQRCTAAAAAPVRQAVASRGQLRHAGRRSREPAAAAWECLAKRRRHVRPGVPHRDVRRRRGAAAVAHAGLRRGAGRPVPPHLALRHTSRVCRRRRDGGAGTPGRGRWIGAHARLLRGGPPGRRGRWQRAAAAGLRGHRGVAHAALARQHRRRRPLARSGCRVQVGRAHGAAAVAGRLATATQCLAITRAMAGPSLPQHPGLDACCDGSPGKRGFEVKVRLHGGVVADDRLRWSVVVSPPGCGCGSAVRRAACRLADGRISAAAAAHQQL
eukprot:362120-Chlamydomonas_euryale.AAC.10